jgi:dipeptidyl-peptidase-4
MDNETKDFDASKKYLSIPGPGSQQVANQWNSANDYWFMMPSTRIYRSLCRWTGLVLKVLTSRK